MQENEEPMILNDDLQLNEIIFDDNNETSVTEKQTVIETNSETDKVLNQCVLVHNVMTENSFKNGGNESVLYSEEEINNMPIIFEVTQTASTTEPTEVSKELENEPDSSKAADRSLETILTWPKTPQRKGKRDIKRMPYALTGTQYRNIKKQQQEEKDKKEEEKINRQKLRIEKKNNAQKCSKGIKNPGRNNAVLNLGKKTDMKMSKRLGKMAMILMKRKEARLH